MVLLVDDMVLTSNEEKLERKMVKAQTSLLGNTCTLKQRKLSESCDGPKYQFRNSRPTKNTEKPEREPKK